MRTTNICTQKIDGTILETFGMVIAAFSVTDQANRLMFFEKIFLVINVSPDVVFGMPYLILNNEDIDFWKRELWWKSYIIEEALFIIKRVKLVGKKEFTAAALDPRHKTFVVHVAFHESPSNNKKGDVHLFCRAQIVAWIANEASTLILTEYSEFGDVFSPELASKLPE